MGLSVSRGVPHILEVSSLTTTKKVTAQGVLRRIDFGISRDDMGCCLGSFVISPYSKYPYIAPISPFKGWKGWLFKFERCA